MFKIDELKKYVAYKNQGNYNYIEVCDSITDEVIEVGVSISDWVYIWFDVLSNECFYSHHYSQRNGKRSKDCKRALNLMDKMKKQDLSQISVVSELLNETSKEHSTRYIREYKVSVA